MAVLTVGVASSALFDLTCSERVFAEKGLEAYRRYQAEHLDKPLSPGPAQPFVRRLLALNEVVDDAVDVIVMSRNSAETGLRVMRSVEAAGLAISRAVFRDGLSSYDFMPALEMSLFLSANRQDGAEAVAAGHPAGTVLGGIPQDTDAVGLRVAFDFDGVLADDSSERVYRDGGLPEFSRHERELAEQPLQQGPLADFLKGLNQIQIRESDMARQDLGYQPRLRVCLVTARSAPAHERAVNSLRAWGLRVDDAFFLGGRPKAPVIEILRPHIFFDDQTQQLVGLHHTPLVHVPFGVANVG